MASHELIFTDKFESQLSLNSQYVLPLHAGNPGSIILTFFRFAVFSLFTKSVLRTYMQK